jgi:hypothetical protein
MLVQILIWALAATNVVIATQKICVNCKYYIEAKSPAVLYGKCAAFPKYMLPHTFVKKRIDTIQYLVSGNPIEPKNTGYFHCATARSIDLMCGVEGKYFIPRENTDLYDYIPPQIDNSGN